MSMFLPSCDVGCFEHLQRLRDLIDESPPRLP